MSTQEGSPVASWDCQLRVSAGVGGGRTHTLEGIVRFRRRLGRAEAGKHVVKMVWDRMPAAGLHSLLLDLDWDLLGRDVGFRAVGREACP